jgi:hypothetical protein
VSFLDLVEGMNRLYLFIFICYDGNVVRKSWVVSYCIYLLIAWSIFRYFVRLPEVIEELWFKPLVWLMPVFWMTLATRMSPSFLRGDLVKSLLYGSVSGLAAFLLVRLIIVHTLDIPSVNRMGMAFSTAVVEGTALFGFVLWGLKAKSKTINSELILIFSLIYLVIHLPIALFVYDLTGIQLVGYSILNLSVGGIGAYLCLYSNSAWAGILFQFLLLTAV